MAGIGWKLQKMIDRGSFAGTMGAYITGVAVTSAPWLLTSAVLMSLRVAARSDGTAQFQTVQRIVTLVYALTVILSAPVHVVVSRYTADRLYDRQLDRIAAPFWRALAATLVGFLVVGVTLMVVLRAPLTLALVGTSLTVVVGAQWLLLSVGGGLTSPLVVLRAFCAGAPVGVLASLWLYRTLGLGAAGYLVGFAAGQLVTMLLLLEGVARVLPAQSSEEARLLPAFGEYALLALSSLVYYVSIWTDKAVLWALAGSGEASLYSGVSAIAWFSVVPTFGWIYVQIETVFYRRFRAFYGGLGGGAPLALVREKAGLLAGEAMRILRGAVMVQGGVLVLAVAGADVALRLAGLPRGSAGAFRLAALGAALQLMSLLEILLLYYFDLRREALAVSLALFAAEIVFMSAAHALRLSPCVGYALACASAAGVGLFLVRSRLSTLVADTFQTQPYGDAI
jgi:uncharacterized membrane protein